MAFLIDSACEVSVDLTSSAWLCEIMALMLSVVGCGRMWFITSWCEDMERRASEGLGMRPRPSSFSAGVDIREDASL